jgi:hypothetical protein
VFRKLHAIRAPEMLKVRTLWRESATSHGRNESIDATDAPRPNKTSNDGRAQQSSVLTELNSEK